MIGTMRAVRKRLRVDDPTVPFGRLLSSMHLIVAAHLACVLPASQLLAQAPPAPREVNEVWLSIGAVDGPSEEVFHQLSNPTFLEDGRVVVPDAGSSEIRIFDQQGEVLSSTGRPGDGPGEYRSIRRVFPYRGDSIAVFDERLQRVTVLSGDGERRRTLSLSEASTSSALRPGDHAPVSARTFVVGTFDDGGFLVRRGEVSVSPGDTTAVRRDHLRFLRIDPLGRKIADLFVLADDEQFVWAEGGSRSVRPRAFGLTTHVSTEGDRVYVADNTGFRVTIYDRTGRRLTTIEAQRRRPPVGEPDRRRWMETELGRLEGRLLRRVAEQSIRAMPFPDAMPLHGDLITSSDGRVWLEEYRPPYEKTPVVWTVFGSDGRVDGRFALPPGFRLTWAGASRVLGVETDDLGVERVVGYRLP